MLESLKERVCQANLDLVAHGLVTLTWGNVSGIDRDAGCVAIKPSGVPYDRMRPEHMVLVDLDGNVVEGDLNPSTDTPTHVLLYRHFDEVGGIAHTHSHYGTVFAQARMAIACHGTTHADYFMGPVPVTRPLTERELKEGYEHNTGQVILETFQGVRPMEVPAVLVAGHAPFAWGRNASEAVKIAVALEAIARLALDTRRLRPDAPLLESHVLDKHYQRKHGPNATYGQR